METLSVLKAFFWLVVFSGVIFLLAWWIVRYGKRQFQMEDEYEKLYQKIMIDVETMKVYSHNYDIILYNLEKLGSLKWKNTEKTHVITMSFFRKFASEAKKRVNGNLKIHQK